MVIHFSPRNHRSEHKKARTRSEAGFLLASWLYGLPLAAGGVP